MAAAAEAAARAQVARPPPVLAPARDAARGRRARPAARAPDRPPRPRAHERTVLAATARGTGARILYDVVAGWCLSRTSAGVASAGFSIVLIRTNFIREGVCPIPKGGHTRVYNPSLPLRMRGHFSDAKGSEKKRCVLEGEVARAECRLPFLDAVLLARETSLRARSRRRLCPRVFYLYICRCFSAPARRVFADHHIT